VDTEVVETVRGKHRRVEIRKQRGVISDTKYTLYDPDKAKTVSGTFSRLDEAYQAAEKYVNS
jgi:hypothetical protein